MAGVRILNIAKVNILNTQFRNIQAIQEMKDLGQCSKFAAGLTAVSSLVNMKNTTFSNVSAESVVPSVIYVDIKLTYGLPNQLIMNNVLVETNSPQNWVDDMIWHLSTDFKDFKESRNNVTMRCLGGHQKIRKIGNEKNEFLYCVRCNTSSYNVQTPAFVWNKPTGLSVINNTCHKRCPYQAMCTNGLRSRGNYWGIVTNRSGIVEFFQCPPSYCCSSQRDCGSYNTCTNNRRGRLCGDCKAGHSIALFGPNRCVPNDNCKHDLLWIPYAFTVISVSYTHLTLPTILLV